MGAGALVLGFCSAASAQTRPVTRADVSATIGWLGVDTSSGSSGQWLYHRWDSRLFGSAGAGWDPTDHLKTEVDFGAGREGEGVSHQLEPGHCAARITAPSPGGNFRGATSASASIDQFFRNAWFHPHLAAGVHLAWERRTDHTQPIFSYNPVTGTSGQEAPRSFAPETKFVVRPFVGAGFKAYMTRQAFFRSDLLIGFRNGIDEARLQFGFGADF